MAIKFKTTFDDRALQKVLDKIDALQKPITKRVANGMGNRIVALMKQMIAAGKSTIAGRGKFPAYRGGYRDQILRFGSVRVKKRNYSKKISPVSLKLTGKFQRALTRKSVNVMP